MSHRNLPALNKYTSQTQYEALKVVDETKSIVQIVQNGQSSKTLGALVRSMWIKQTDYADDKGVLREGWFVTDDGRQAMNLYAEKERQQKEEKQLYTEKVMDLLVKCKSLKEVIDKYRVRKKEIKTEWAQIETEIDSAMVQVANHSWCVSNSDLKEILRANNLPENWFRPHTYNEQSALQQAGYKGGY